MRTTDDLVHFLREFRQGGIVNFTLTAGTIDMLKESADLLEWYAKRVAWLERPRSPKCDDCASGDHSTHDRKNDCDMVVFDCAADELERAELNLKAADAALAETQARYEKDIRTLNARTGKVIDARNAFVAGASTAEQLCDKIDAAIFGDSLSQPDPPSFHPNLVAFAPEEI